MEIEIPLVWICLLILFVISLLILQWYRNYYIWCLCTAISGIFIFASPIQDASSHNQELTNCIDNFSIDSCRLSIVGMWLFQVLTLTLVYPLFKLSWDCQMCLDPDTPITSSTCIPQSNQTYVAQKTKNRALSCTQRCIFYIIYGCIFIINGICKMLLCFRCISIYTFLKIGGFLHMMVFISFYNLKSSQQHNWRVVLECFWIWVVPIYMCIIRDIYYIYKGKRVMQYSIGEIRFKYITTFFLLFHYFLYIISWGVLKYYGESFSVNWVYYYLLLTWTLQFWIIFYYKNRNHSIQSNASFPTPTIVDRFIQNKGQFIVDLTGKFNSTPVPLSNDRIKLIHKRPKTEEEEKEEDEKRRKRIALNDEKEKEILDNFESLVGTSSGVRTLDEEIPIDDHSTSDKQPKELELTDISIEDKNPFSVNVEFDSNGSKEESLNKVDCNGSKEGSLNKLP